MENNNSRTTLQHLLQQKLTGDSAPEQSRDYWRSLDELADTAVFQTWLRQEFPQGTAVLTDPISRRAFLKLAAASLGLAGLAACTPRQGQSIVPYVDQPEAVVPGVPLTFATAVSHAGYALGVLAESHQGRPVKLEGNPHHPATLGASDPFIQAAILSLYDPDRAQTVKGNGRIRTWSDFLVALEQALPGSGQGVRLLTGAVTSPTLLSQIAQILQQMPQARWIQHEPIDDANGRRGTEIAFGQPLATRCHFQQADVILSLADDFLQEQPGHLAYARAFALRRTIRADSAEMNRLYVVEATPTLTGSMADHRWPLRPSQIESFARAVARELGLDVPAGADLPPALAQQIPALAADLQSRPGRALVTAGLGQPPAVHALAHAMNDVLGSIGQTIVYTEPVTSVTVAGGLGQLVQEMAAGDVQALLILDSNPAYTAPGDTDFAGALANVPFSAALSLYEDETAVLCDWLIPLAHSLEAWSDGRAFEGTASIVQPLIEPLYDGHTPHELLAAAAGRPGSNSYDLVRQHWQDQYNGDNFDQYWQQILHDGVIPDTAVPPQPVTRQPFDLPAPAPPAEGVALIFQPSPSVWDGRYANNGWLQELPQPFTKITWGNAAFISPVTAARLNVANGDMLRLQTGEQTLDAPAWIMPGQADDCVTLPLGYGRSRAGSTGSGVGVDAYRLRRSDALWLASGVQVEKASGAAALATTQNHYLMEGRDLVRAGEIDEFRQDPAFLRHAEQDTEQPSLYPDIFANDGYAWGMSIDLNVCIGCNACTIACQAENNIPVVGAEEVRNGREMHWIRVDGYFKGDLDNPEYFHEPVPCMHCEKAPCEPVCPVAATTHSTEGLNEMTYNRCVGTRYCANNCPYKVRRFNFLQYSQTDIPVLNNAYNPDVTIRPRGVMEKCTYCVQRINRARIGAKKDGRSLQDGDVVTACQQACPTQAISFGDIHDESSDVAQRKAQPHDFSLLYELGTRPRTSYLAVFRNPNPQIEA